MSPVLLLLLLLAALNAESTLLEDNTGQKFIVAFPENIAYYYPKPPKNIVQITALHNNTAITIKTHTFHTTAEILSAGQTKEFILDARLELFRANISDKTLQIKSNETITVHAISLKNNSLQTALVIPTDKLGTKYLIPPVPIIKGTTDSTTQVTTAVIERSPFKLFIVNGDQESSVTVEGKATKTVSLQPNQVAQIWVKEDEALRVVKADQPVAVLFGHACAVRYNCTCGLLYTMLPPAKEKKMKFYIPPHLATKAEAETFILLSEEGSTDMKLFNPDSPVVKTAGTAVLYRPGLLLTLIPEAEFAACSVVNSIPETETFVVIVVHKDSTDGVHVGSQPLQSPKWEELKGTEYVSTQIVLAEGKSFVWHSYSKMAVYFVGENGFEGMFGNPAPIISKTPDFRGCAVTPTVVKIGEVAAGWRESLKYCKDNGLELVSFPQAIVQKQIYDRILQVNTDSLKEVWIGMRRSSQSGEWYWLSKDPVNDTNWAEGEPGTVQDGQCVIMSLEKGKDFGWSDEDCCKAAHPVCYSEPVLLPL